MKLRLSFGMILILLSSILLNATIVKVPHEYDNTYNSIRSKSSIVISSASPTLSLKVRTLAGASVRFRCVTIDKIPCRGATPLITLSVTDAIILDPNNQLLALYGYEAFAESTGTNKWNICGGAVGGYNWDESILTSRTTTNNIILDYKYTPNKFNRTYWFFTSSSNTGSSRSHMLISVQQKCR